MLQNWDEHRMRNTEKTTKRAQISTKRANTYFYPFFMRNSTKRQENSKKHTVKILGIFFTKFGTQQVQLARTKV